MSVPYHSFFPVLLLAARLFPLPCILSMLLTLFAFLSCLYLLSILLYSFDAFSFTFLILVSSFCHFFFLITFSLSFFPYLSCYSSLLFFLSISCFPILILSFCFAVSLLLLCFYSSRILDTSANSCHFVDSILFISRPNFLYSRFITFRYIHFCSSLFSCTSLVFSPLLTSLSYSFLP